MNKIKLHTPNYLHIGFQKRADTFAGLLGFISFNQNNKLVNSTAFHRWISKSIPQKNIQNNNTSGFILSKSNHHQLSDRVIGFTRVFHPEGFDFEIPSENIYYLMQYTLIDHGQISNECKIYFDEKFKPWILTEEAINSGDFEVIKVNDFISDRVSSEKIPFSTLSVGSIVNIHDEPHVVVNSLQKIYPYQKNHSMFYFKYYLMNLSLDKTAPKQGLLSLKTPNNLENCYVKNTKKDVALSKNIIDEQLQWAKELTQNNFWNFIDWSDHENEIEKSTNGLKVMMEMLSLTNFNELILQDVKGSLEKKTKKQVMAKVMLSSFCVKKDNVKYRLLMTNNNHVQLLSCFNKSLDGFLPNNDFFIFALHMGMEELRVRKRDSTEVFQDTHIVPIASLSKSMLNEDVLDFSVKALESVLIKKGFDE